MVNIFHCGPAALISALFDEPKIGQTIDEMATWDQAQCHIHMSPGGAHQGLDHQYLQPQAAFFK